MKGYCFFVNGDPGAARDMVYKALTDQGFVMTPLDEWSADANRGSSGKSILLGAFAGKKGRHVKLRVQCQTNSGGYMITLAQGTTGFSGGIIGKSQADGIYVEVYNAIDATLRTAGILTSCNPID